MTSSRLGRLLGPFDEDPGGPGGWWILDEPELHFGDQVVVPDLAGWRRERLPAVPEEAHFSLAPDWVCEVLSPSTERIDRGRKLRIYAEAGVAHAWFVNPVERTLEVLRLRDGAWTIVAVCSDSDRVRVEPFEAIEMGAGPALGRAASVATRALARREGDPRLQRLSGACSGPASAGLRPGPPLRRRRPRGAPRRTR